MEKLRSNSALRSLAVSSHDVGLLPLDSHGGSLALVLALSGSTERLGSCFHGPLSCSGEISTSWLPFEPHSSRH